jgi:tetratricopeptide (TPR) repeat protein
LEIQKFMNTQTQPRPAPPIKGSWEDLLNQARQHAINYNDQAVLLYRKVFDGLRRLPESQRKGGKGRLQSILMLAGMELQGYLNTQDRYDEALEVIDQLRAVTTEPDNDFWDSHRIDILLQAGRNEEAFGRLHQRAEAEDAELGDWGQLIMAYVRAGRSAEALPLFSAMEAHLAAKQDVAPLADQAEAVGEAPNPQALEPAANEAERTSSYIAGLRGVVALELNQWQEGIQHFEEAMAAGGAYADNLHLLYGRLVNLGRYSEAERFIGKDQKRPIRAAFWRGLALSRQGNRSAAQAAWERAAKLDPTKDDPDSFVENVLIRYYLGDTGGNALSAVLRAIREQQRTVPWILFFLAAVGWLLRGDDVSARSNFNLAISQRKASADGAKLPYHLWQMVSDLFSPEIQDQYRSYFEAAPLAPAPPVSDLPTE